MSDNDVGLLISFGYLAFCYSVLIYGIIKYGWKNSKVKGVEK